MGALSAKKNPQAIIIALLFSFLFAYPTSATSTESNLQENDHSAGILPSSAKTCITSECHQNVIKEKYVHPTSKEGKCLTCHEPPKKGTPYESGKKHTFALKGKDAELCLPCHPIGEKEYVHETIKKGICLECHNPHQSQYANLLKSNPVSTLCLKCHLQGIFKGKTIHGPVALGHCNICHEPHESYYESLTRGDPTEECYKCHEQEKLSFNQEFVHKPVREDCNDCHDPHASADSDRLLLATPAVCYDCHKKQEKHIEGSQIKHDALTEGELCFNCHTSHASQIPKLLKNAPIELCIVCHNEKMETPYGNITNMAAYLDDNSYVHGPIRQGDCSACHNPHGSDYWRIVKQYFPQEFYAPFSLGMYELCFGCHEKTVILTEQTTTLTGFRNGPKNLHFLHVNKEVKGRTCKACHDIHASNNPMHVAYDFPFGQWSLPINYTALEKGGRCTPGCHETKEFNRVDPVDNTSQLLEKYGGEEESDEKKGSEKKKGRRRRR
jgi:predicted CXXCH cytochrome family protein